MKINKVVETCVYSPDLIRMKHFYAGKLGLRLVEEEKDRFIFLQAGKSMLLVFNPAKTSAGNGSLPAHGATAPARIHFALEIEAGDYQRWKELLAKNDIAIEKEVSWKEKAKSIYFRDPAGNLVELITPGEWPVES